LADKQVYPTESDPGKVLQKCEKFKGGKKGLHMRVIVQQLRGRLINKWQKNWMGGGGFINYRQQLEQNSSSNQV